MSSEKGKSKLKKEVARELLWYRGIVSWKFHAGQLKIDEAFNSIKRKLFVGNCSRRYGKTFWALTKAVECALNCKNDQPRIKYAAATKLELKEFALPAMDSILRDCPADIAPVYKATESKFVFPNGAEIQLIGLDKRPDGGRGNYCDLYIFEEAGFIDNLPYLYGSVVLPMTLRRPGAKVIMISTPPRTPAHPFQEFCERAQKQNAYVELNILSNPMLTPEEVAEAKAECLDESEWLREYMCQFVVDANRAIIPEFTPDLVGTIERPSYFNYLHRYVTMDLGVKIDLTAIIYGYWEPKIRKLIIEDEAEINGPEMTTIGLRDLLIRKEQELWRDPRNGEPISVHKRISDSDNPLLIQDLGNLHNIYFWPTGKDSLSAMVNELRVLVKNGQILINPKCLKTIGCLKYGIWNNKRSGFDRSRLYGHFDHLAALIYMVRNLDQHTDPVPDLINPNPSKQHLRKRSMKSKAVDTIKKMLNI